MDQLSDITDEQVSELQTSILSEFESVEKEDPTPQTVDAMTSLADMLDGVRNEIKRREVATVELAQKAAEATNRVYGKEDEDKDMETTEVKDAAMHEEAPAAPAEEAPVTEEAPVSETPAPTMEEEKKMEEAAAMPATPEATPKVEEEEKSSADMEEDKKEEKEMEKTMTEASTEADKKSEFSTEVKETTEAAVAVEETVVAAVAEAPATTTTTAEVPVVAEAAVVEEVAVSQDAPAAEAAVVVTEGAEAAIIETPTQTETVQTAQETMEAPVTAAADNADNLNIEVPADRRPTSRTTEAAVAITAGADIPGYTAGSSISSMAEVAEAMAKRLHGLRRVNGGDGEQHIVASISTQFPEARTLNQDAQANWDKVQAVVGP